MLFESLNCLLHRLITISRLVRFIIITATTLIFLGLFGFVYKGSGTVMTIVMVLIGGVIGYVIGKYASAVVTVAIEWQAQMLVGVENVVNLL